MSRILSANHVVIDVETTGLDYAAGDRVVQVAAVRLLPKLEHFAWSREYEIFRANVNPGRPIPAVASAVHHLVDRDVASAPPIAMVAKTLRRFLHDDAIVWAHNAPFDCSFLPELADYRWLDTKRLAQHLVPDAPSYANQVLHYHLGLEVHDAPAHEALGDARVTAHLLAYLIGRYLESHDDDLDAFLAFADGPLTYTHWPFGKHRNLPISQSPPDYIAWCLRTMTLDADLRASLEAELARRGVAA